ncbi:helix-turn-helix transcriptional regulator [Mucilaginibacter ginkgonis]|uniref:YafY family transcriptional regulator n=1 Tax=Mucilaginibacter ginkgonis TaxID=2682091 RepID=A0A6I4I2Q1_9SPHI|nr:YafY family protein [Mucilaginibacter ginkgonis]QQL49194.1 YafY family transcriptional regulator [Mucilaginibacter ginkgonis]
MNRIDRISAILIQLQSRKTVRAQDIADRFDISLRTVYRDVKTLEEAGIPLIGEAGVGYSIVDGYRLPPVMFTRDEAAAFLTAEKMVNKLTDADNSASYSSAMFKIRSVLRSAEKDYLESIEQNIEVLKFRGHHAQKAAPQNQLQLILQAVAKKEVLRLKYKRPWGELVESRDIEPVGVFYLDNYWHLIAWCRLRSDYRDFRFDRMESLGETGLHFDTIHPPLSEHLNKMYKDTELLKIVIRITREAAPYLGEQRFYHGFVSEQLVGDEVEMQFLSPSLEGFARWMMVFADQVRIISPPELKQRVKAIAKIILEEI